MPQTGTERDFDADFNDMGVTREEFLKMITAGYEELMSLPHKTIMIELPVTLVGSLIGQIQLALRHPENNDVTARHAERFARGLQEALTQNGACPTWDKVINFSWLLNEKYRNQKP